MPESKCPNQLDRTLNRLAPPRSRAHSLCNVLSLNRAQNSQRAVGVGMMFRVTGAKLENKMLTKCVIGEPRLLKGLSQQWSARLVTRSDAWRWRFCLLHARHHTSHLRCGPQPLEDV